MQFSTTVRNARADQVETTIGVSAHLKIFTGAAPVNCGTADSGTMLTNMALPSDWMANASAGSKAMTGSWSGTGAAAGNAGYYRIYDSGVTNCHIQGPICYASNAWVISTVYALNVKVNANGNVYNCSQAGTSLGSGTGPSGTGTGIVDNTAKWDYVSAICEMTMDNINVSNGQTVNVASFSFTEGNP